MNKSSNTTQDKSILSPKVDVVFQILFGEIGSEKITKDLLSSFLSEKIDKIDLSENVITRREQLDDKLGIVDVLARINNNELCNIEMQVIQNEYILKRILFYWSRLYSREIKKRRGLRKFKKDNCCIICKF